MSATKGTAGEIIELIREEAIVDLDDGFGPADDLFTAGLDSMALMQLLVAVGEKWNVTLEAADVTKENFATATALATLLDLRRT